MVGLVVIIIMYCSNAIKDALSAHNANLNIYLMHRSVIMILLAYIIRHQNHWGAKYNMYT